MVYMCTTLEIYIHWPTWISVITGIIGRKYCWHSMGHPIWLFRNKPTFIFYPNILWPIPSCTIILVWCSTFMYRALISAIFNQIWNHGEYSYRDPVTMTPKLCGRVKQNYAMSPSDSATKKRPPAMSSPVPRLSAPELTLMPRNPLLRHKTMQVIWEYVPQDGRRYTAKFFI